MGRKVCCSFVCQTDGSVLKISLFVERRGKKVVFSIKQVVWRRYRERACLSVVVVARLMATRSREKWFPTSSVVPPLNTLFHTCGDRTVSFRGSISLGVDEVNKSYTQLTLTTAWCFIESFRFTPFASSHQLWEALFNLSQL